MEALIVIEGIVIVLLVVLVAGLLRSHAEILRQLDALGGGEPHEAHLAAPRRLARSGTTTTITGTNPAGVATTISLSGTRGHTLLAFLSTTCTSCVAFWKEAVPSLSGVRPVVVTKGAEAESPAAVSKLMTASVSTLMSTEAWESFAVPATPYFVLVDNSNAQTVGEGSAPTWGQVEDMMRRAMADDRHSLRRSTRERKADIDEELMAAGIEPGDTRLYQPPVDGQR
ncbi:MAG: hypothetical protein ACRDWA_08665 [Acidimicrobiia bacterium]